ncbi:MAG: iron chelate uptake ABC transporter family permease subunit [Candidatus Latescibacteria bacterium]|nr:iron chelate uptake ABC transporter family permease subunit [Candidatus Latescibacterota bacterium]
MGVGAVPIPAGWVARTILGHLPVIRDWVSLAGIDPSVATIVWDIRLPRTLLAVLVGAALATSGGVMQGFFQNPMADPYIIGISAGAALGATVAIAFKVEFWLFGLNAVPIIAFASALVVTFLVYFLSRRGGRVSSGTLLLTGIAVGSLATSMTSFLMVIAGEDQRTVLFWLMGSLSARRWDHLRMLLPYVTVGLAVVIVFARDLNVLLLGDEQAAHLGINVERVKVILLVAAACLAAAAVAVSGIIGFVGLIVPHLVRLAVGPDYRTLTPTAAIAGGLLLVLSDTLARTVVAPAEMPIGIITTFLGGPFFLYLLHRQRNRLF